MKRDFIEAIKHRRSYYSIDNNVKVSDKEIEKVVEDVVLHVPSAFNSQSSRLVLLLGDSHKKLWSIVKEELRKIVPAENFKATEDKIDYCFAAGHGTILFYEDTSVVKGLQDSFPSYAANFPVWSEHTSAMHQFAAWTALEDLGLGGSLQHYHPLIDAEVAKTWDIPAEWKLTAQLVFGNPLQEPGEKAFEPIEKRLKIYK